MRTSTQVNFPLLCADWYMSTLRYHSHNNFALGVYIRFPKYPVLVYIVSTMLLGTSIYFLLVCMSTRIVQIPKGEYIVQLGNLYPKIRVPIYGLTTSLLGSMNKLKLLTYHTFLPKYIQPIPYFSYRNRGCSVVLETNQWETIYHKQFWIVRPFASETLNQ